MAEWAKEQDFEEILQKADIIFGGEGNTDYFQLYHPKLYAVRNSATEHLVIRDEDGIQGFLGVFPAEMDICGRKIKVDGFGTMGVMKSARGKGYMKDLMDTAVNTSKERADIAFLGGRRQRYEYFGFTPSGITPSFSFNRDNAKHCLKDADTSIYTFDEAKTAEEAKFFAELYNRRPARVIRTEESFLTTLKSCRSVAISIRKNGKLFGYAAVNGEGRSINEIEVLNIEELPAVLSSYINAYDFRGVSIGGVFLFEKEKLKVLDSVCEGMTLPCCESFLIHDYVKLLDALFALKATYTKLYPCKAVLNIEGYCKVAIETQEDSFKVYETDAPADANLKPMEATRVLFGNSACIGIRDDLPQGLKANLPLPLFYSRPDFV